MPRHYTVTFVESGTAVDVTEDEGVLGAGLRAGLALAFDCQKGRCKTCMVKVDGIIDQTDAWLISNDELAEGYALICVGKPRSNLRVHA
jgi:ferredoxin